MPRKTEPFAEFRRVQDRNGKRSLLQSVPAIENQSYRTSAGVNSKVTGILPYQLMRIVPDHGIEFVHIASKGNLSLGHCC